MPTSSHAESVEEEDTSPLLGISIEPDVSPGALNYLSRAAHESLDVPASPNSVFNRSGSRPPGSVSPIKRIPKASSNEDFLSGRSSDEEANLVVVENPDGSLVEGMPLGFKHATPVASPPHTPRTLNFGITGIDLVDLFKRHERIFLGLLVSSVLIDAVVLSEEFTTIVSAIGASSGHIQWASRVGNILPNLDKESASQVSSSVIDSQSRHTFSVFPPHWQLGWCLAIACLDSLVCVGFFAAGFIAYVSKQRKAYAWFGTISCSALIWQVILSCVDKLSLVLFLFRLAAFTHGRFMGDLMDDITLLATLISGRQVLAQVEQISTQGTAGRDRIIDSTV